MSSSAAPVDDRLDHHPPQSAYIHVPFCRHRCGYCNFTLVAGRDELIPRYLKALALELERLAKPRPVQTLFLGGGTPTHLRADQLDELLKLVLHWHPLQHEGELTVEANPEDVDSERSAVLQGHGVNRISLGVQSFSQSKLSILERGHDSETIHSAVARCRPFATSISFDLIFAAPFEQRSEWEQDLESAVRLQPDHLSTYGLTFEEGTMYWSRKLRGELSELDDDDWRQRYETTMEKLTAAGFEHYEVSSFAQPGHRCRHNQTYWTGGRYYAAGPGAARFLGFKRETNHRSVTTYMKRLFASASPVAEEEWLTAESYARECLVFGLRRMEGIRRAEFLQRTGLDVSQLAGPKLREYVGRGWLEDDGDRIRLTAAALPISDALWPALL